MLTVRPETIGDAGSVRSANLEAFGRIEEPEIVDKLRTRGAVTLSLVAAKANEVVGHISFSPVTVESDGSSFEAVALGTMAVLPSHQRKGVGSQLVRAGLEECRRLGHEIVFVVGHPGYYPRFGFVPAKPKVIDCEFEVPNEAWMVLEPREGALAGSSGTVKFQPEFREGV